MRGRWVDELIVRTRREVDDLLARADRRPVLGVTLRIVRDLLSIDVRDRIFGLAGQSFLALVPLMIITAGLLSVRDEAGLADLINARLQLDAQTARTVEVLFSTPTATGTASVISALILLLSVNSYARTMRRSVERPWHLPKAGWRAQAHGLAAILVFIAMHFSIALLATAWRGGPPETAVLEVIVQTLMLMAFWWVITFLLAARRISWLHLLPGAVAGGIAQSLAGWWSVTFLPSILERQTSRYGVIGVSLGIVTWLLVASGITVGVGIVGARIARAAGWLTVDEDREPPRDPMGPLSAP